MLWVWEELWWTVEGGSGPKNASPLPHPRPALSSKLWCSNAATSGVASVPLRPENQVNFSSSWSCWYAPSDHPWLLVWMDCTQPLSSWCRGFSSEPLFQTSNVPCECAQVLWPQVRESWSQSALSQSSQSDHVFLWNCWWRLCSAELSSKSAYPRKDWQKSSTGSMISNCELPRNVRVISFKESQITCFLVCIIYDTKENMSLPSTKTHLPAESAGTWSSLALLPLQCPNNTGDMHRPNKWYMLLSITRQLSIIQNFLLEHPAGPFHAPVPLESLLAFPGPNGVKHPKVVDRFPWRFRGSRSLVCRYGCHGHEMRHPKASPINVSFDLKRCCQTDSDCVVGLDDPRALLQQLAGGEIEHQIIIIKRICTNGHLQSQNSANFFGKISPNLDWNFQSLCKSRHGSTAFLIKVARSPARDSSSLASLSVSWAWSGSGWSGVSAWSFEAWRSFWERNLSQASSGSIASAKSRLAMLLGCRTVCAFQAATAWQINVGPWKFHGTISVL